MKKLMSLALALVLALSLAACGAPSADDSKSGGEQTPRQRILPGPKRKSPSSSPGVWAAVRT